MCLTGRGAFLALLCETLDYLLYGLSLNFARNVKLLVLSIVENDYCVIFLEDDNQVIVFGSFVTIVIL